MTRIRETELSTAEATNTRANMEATSSSEEKIEATETVEEKDTTVHEAEAISKDDVLDLLASDDSFLAQIDEFRARAQKLQQMMVSRETRAQELKVLVDEREDKAEELKQILDERQEEVDGISAVVAKQINALTEQVGIKLDAIEKAVSGDNANAQKASAETTEQMKETLGQVSVQIESLKADLADKIHTESVKSYRNTQDVLKDMDEKLDQLEDVEIDVRSLHGYAKVIIGVIAVNLVGVIIAVLGAFGIF